MWLQHTGLGVVRQPRVSTVNGNVGGCFLHQHGVILHEAETGWGRFHVAQVPEGCACPQLRLFRRPYS